MTTVAEATVVTFSCPACGAPFSVPWGQRAGIVSCSSCSASRPFQEGILLFGAGGRNEDYPPAVYAQLAAVEDQHFWFAARNDVIVAALSDTGTPLRDARALDIGCGSGYVVQALEQRGLRITGMDMHHEGLRHARQRSRALLVCDPRGDVPAGQFDLVLLTDVIEHVDDDRRLLRQAARALLPGGRLLVTVPAHQWLWSRVDDLSGHKRRYGASSLRRTLRDAGLRPVLVRYFNHVSVPLLGLQRRGLGRTADSAVGPEELMLRAFRAPPALLNALLRCVSRIELKVRRLPIPFGGSLVAIATPE